MEFQISAESRWATQMCPSGFSCLTGDRKDLCAVEQCGNGHAHFIKCLEDGTSCSYRNPLEHGNYCMCSVRQEIFKNYRI